jgi:hypothetical protein
MFIDYLPSASNCANKADHVMGLQTSKIPIECYAKEKMVIIPEVYGKVT